MMATDERGSLLTGVVNILIGIFLVSLVLALFRHFDWDIGQVLDWFFGMVWFMIESIGDWFASLPIFQQWVKL